LRRSLLSSASGTFLFFIPSPLRSKWTVFSFRNWPPPSPFPSSTRVLSKTSPFFPPRRILAVKDRSSPQLFFFLAVGACFYVSPPEFPKRVGTLSLDDPLGSPGFLLATLFLGQRLAKTKPLLVSSPGFASGCSFPNYFPPLFTERACMVFPLSFPGICVSVRIS